MQLPEERILELISTENYFTDETKKQIPVEKVCPKFIYRRHELSETEYDTDIECVAELTIKGQTQLKRLCLWYDTKSEKISDMILIMPLTISYYEVEMIDGSSSWGFIFNEQLSYIRESQGANHDDYIRIIAVSHVKCCEGQPEDIKSCILYDQNLSKCDAVTFEENI